MIDTNLFFPNLSNKKADKYHKRGRVNIKIFLASIYHPVEHDDQKQFNKELASFYNTIPRNAELLAGQEVKSNIRIWSKIFRDLIGPNVIDNRNSKGKELLFLLNSIKLIVLLTYFRHDNYTTWRSLTLLDLHIC